MNLKQIKYKIALLSGSREVTGYAIDCDLPVRLCVRIENFLWRVDHYDTGYFIGPLFNSRQEAIERGFDIVRRNIESGKYAQLIRAYNRNPGSFLGENRK